METSTPPAPPAPATSPIREDLLFELLAHPGRRAILRRAARGEPCIAGDLSASGVQRRAAMNKQLQTLAAAGLLRHTVDPRNKRRYCYTLVPGPVYRRTPDGGELDFGCCLLRW